LYVILLLFASRLDFVVVIGENITASVRAALTTAFLLSTTLLLQWSVFFISGGGGDGLFFFFCGLCLSGDD